MSPRYFSKDFLEFLRLLSAHEVIYLVVGGEAVIYHGYARLTGDLDIFYLITQENVGRLFRALTEFWGGEPPGLSGPEELLKPGLVLQYGRPPNRIDLINIIDGVTFDEAWKTKIDDYVPTPEGKFSISYIG